MYSSRGQSPRLDGEKYGRFGNTFGGFEYHFAICASSSLSHVSGSENQSSSNAIKSPSICVDKSSYCFVKLSPFLLSFYFLVNHSLQILARNIAMIRLVVQRKGKRVPSAYCHV